MRQSPQTVQNVVTYDVVVSVDNTDLALKPGMTAATRIIIDQRNDVLRVPNQALRYAPGRAHAAKRHGRPNAAAEQAQGLGAARRQAGRRSRSTAGLDDDSFTEIVKGDLKPDDRVIVAEQQRRRLKAAVPRPRL